MNNDQVFLKRAMEIGNRKAEPYNFGAVIVKNGKVIGEDFNHVHELHDPSAHAEISALKMAAQKLGNHNLDGATMYGSHEPCLMCFSCAAWANIGRVVYAVAANDQDFMYEFEGIRLQDMVAHLTRRKVAVEHVPLEEA
ncbi:MAG: nucleoside deaminase [Candidatus Saccharibacteria bacterium]|nr:nucleoside deaminase [Candidatus Saccharibacteria bacterium]